MEAILILVLSTIVLLVASYYVLILLVDLLKKLTQHFRGALKSIFIIAGVVATLWILDNKDNAPKIIQHVKTWVSDMEHVDLMDFELH